MPSYNHGVISDLVSPPLLHAVRTEIQESVHFTPKETDIYRIHQSGDLANLDGLEDSSLKHLPSSLTLRNALYSAQFRDYISDITGSGPLSGKKTDMAINVYTPGCHLLCHDDVIGSRRVSYILYLTNPDDPWKPDWGGALRLYPTSTHKAQNGEEVKVPSPDYSVSIPPAFNQLSFFAVQPGESFHDVEEVYASGKTDEDKRRVRMAISGWYHIPQVGEKGYEEGLEEKLAKKSSLLQLQSHANEFDRPKADISAYDKGKTAFEIDENLTTEDFDFLLQYVSPKYLTPDALYAIFEEFGDTSSLTMAGFLSPAFCESLAHYLRTQENDSKHQLPGTSEAIEASTSWRVAVPPHKHRYLFRRPTSSTLREDYAGKGKGRLEEDRPTEEDPVSALLNNLLPSQPFRKWLRLATGQRSLTYDVMARRFRKGQDYTLATGYDAEQPRLEMILSITPPVNPKEVDESLEASSGPKQDDHASTNDTSKSKDKGKSRPPQAEPADDYAEDSITGGYVAYMASDISTAATADPAIYKSSSSGAEEGEEDTNGILFSVPHPSWNTLSLVLRDQDVMRFVKYLGKDSKTDRWDLVGEFNVEDEDEGIWDLEQRLSDDEARLAGQANEEEESTEVEGEDEDETEAGD